MTHFEYVHFPLPDVASIAHVLDGLDRETIETACARWMEFYINRANIFYDVQLLRHMELCELKFCADNDIHHDELCEYSNEYRGWARQHSNLPQHIDASCAIKQDLKYTYELIRGGNGTRVVTLKSALSRIEQLLGDNDYWRIECLFPVLDAAWFNVSINNDQATARALRKMDYGLYLKTPHWRRVRAAMLLLHRARCQGDGCLIDEGAWFNEHLIHVHHVSYKNRGSERYADLRLLCDRCHREIHGRAS